MPYVVSAWTCWSRVGSTATVSSEAEHTEIALDPPWLSKKLIVRVWSICWSSTAELAKQLFAFLGREVVWHGHQVDTKQSPKATAANLVPYARPYNVITSRVCINGDRRYHSARLGHHATT